MLSSSKHMPEQKQVSQGKPVSVTSPMSLTEEEEVVRGASPLPAVASNTVPVNPFLLSLGNGAIMTAFVGLMSAMQVRGRGFKQRV